MSAIGCGRCLSYYYHLISSLNIPPFLSMTTGHVAGSIYLLYIPSKFEEKALARTSPNSLQFGFCKNNERNIKNCV
jgi:hypothetical protein